MKPNALKKYLESIQLDGAAREDERVSRLLMPTEIDAVSGGNYARGPGVSPWQHSQTGGSFEQYGGGSYTQYSGFYSQWATDPP